MSRPRLVVILGATATGKSALALDLALRLGAEILSADSQQVYRGMDIGTAKPGAEERARVPHHGIDLVDPGEQLCAADFAALADEVIEAAAGRGHPVLVVGGTGLWVRALLRGLAPAPPRDPDLRRALEARCRAEGSAALHAELATLDPAAAARLHPNDHVRVVRALEVARLGGPPLSERQARHGFAEARYPARLLALRLPRDRHRARIRARAEAMLAAGWIEETRRLLEAGYRERLRRVLGYAQIVEHLEGRLDVAVLPDRIASRTWAYARRQRTWLAAEPGVEWIEAEAVLGEDEAPRAALAAELRGWLEAGGEG